MLELIGDVDIEIRFEGDNERDNNELIFQYFGADMTTTKETNTLTRHQLDVLNDGLKMLCNKIEKYLEI